ncbi:MAG: acriflavin resistance protein [Porticoccaceae bacterium]|nr:MAG: acriflavin resistance protein [Porticoccaceae bacterium]
MKRLLDWFIRNPVAANLLMVILAIGGTTALFLVDNEFFPPINPPFVRVAVVYPGAGPLEVEEQICIKIEEALADVDGIKEVRSVASQGLGEVYIEAYEDWDLQRLINDVKNRVDAISTFPADAERPVVSDFTVKSEVAQVVVYGGDDEAAIKELALALKDRLMQIPGVAQVDVEGVRDYVVAVEIPERTLRAYGLSFEEVAQAIRRASVNLPGGLMRNPEGDIQLQVYGQRYRAAEFADVVVRRSADGDEVRLGEIARLADTFEEKNFSVEYEGKKAVRLIARVGESPDTLGTAEAVKRFVDSYPLPPGYRAVIWSDQSRYMRERLEILGKNALQGLVLVFVLLLLFLRPLLALWVSVGIAVAYLGTLMLLPVTGTSLNVLSTFAFLLILGIVVDDAIVVSENVHSHFERGLPGPLAASLGVAGVAKPVVLAVTTTILVFIPLFFVPGMMAQMFEPIPTVAISALTFSLVEALLILPSHLSGLRPERPPRGGLALWLAALRRRVSGGLEQFANRIYAPLLERCLANRPVTIAAFLAALAVTLSLLFGGWLKIFFMPSLEQERILVKAEMQEGVALARLIEVRDQMLAAVARLRADPKARNRDGTPAVRDTFVKVEGSEVLLEVNLSPNAARALSSSELEERLRAQIGEIRGLESLIFMNDAFDDEKDITLRLAGADIEELRAASRHLEEVLASFPGVVNVNDSLSSVRQELRILPRPHAELLGLDLEAVARQVRHAFYGAEAERIPLLREDVKVLVRHPLEERAHYEDLVDMRLATADGRQVPFAEVAEARFAPGYTTIVRYDRMRVVDVFADVVPGQANAAEIVRSVMKSQAPVIAERFPGVRFVVEGQQREMMRLFAAVAIGLGFAVLAMYALLAVEFRSYLQPFYILIAVPFGVAGAILGHLLMGMHFSFPSAFGVLATAGVVVNSNLVLIDRINALREEGGELLEAVRRGTRERLRPILLTSLTTFFGLTPILLETSPSAAALKPMVVSLAFGVLFATAITLLMVPALYVAFERLKERLGFAAEARVEIPPAGEGR